MIIVEKSERENLHFIIYGNSIYSDCRLYQEAKDLFFLPHRSAPWRREYTKSKLH